MGKERGHETIEHAADMGIRGWGHGQFAAFEEVALALFELMMDCEGLEPDLEVYIEAGGGDLEELLVDFLNNLIMRSDIEEAAFLGVEIIALLILDAGKEYRLKAVAHGLPRDRVMERLIREVKAATYFGVSVVGDENGKTTATVVVDL